MKNALATVIAAVLSASAAHATPQVADRSPPAQLQLQAMLFHNGSGTFSQDVLAAGGPQLVNVVASDDPSRATLVLVVVKLAPGAVLRSDAQVHLRVHEQAASGGSKQQQQRVTLDRSVAVGSVERSGTTHLPFWLAGTGCRTLQLQAQLEVPGQKAPAAWAAATLPFVCGE